MNYNTDRRDSPKPGKQTRQHGPRFAQPEGNIQLGMPLTTTFIVHLFVPTHSPESKEPFPGAWVHESFKSRVQSTIPLCPPRGKRKGTKRVQQGYNFTTSRPTETTSHVCCIWYYSTREPGLTSPTLATICVSEGLYEIPCAARDQRPVFKSRITSCHLVVVDHKPVWPTLALKHRRSVGARDPTRVTATPCQMQTPSVA